jgi:alpha-L-fucosidase 2
MNSEALNGSYDVTFDALGQSSADSMPIGNGDLACNVWTQRDGIYLYLSKADGWDENGRLVKLARLKVTMTPNLLGDAAANGTLRQTLRLADAMVVITGGGWEMRIYADACAPVVRCTLRSDVSVSVGVCLEPWRTEPREVPVKESHSPIGLRSADQPERVDADVLLEVAAGMMASCHFNQRSVWRDTLEHQDMGTWIAQGRDPLLHQCFGVLVSAPQMTTVDQRTLLGRPSAGTWSVDVSALTQQVASPAQWLQAIVEQYRTLPEATAGLEAHRQWWAEFWQRSWIDISGDEDAVTVSRAYALQRYMLACAGRGAHPIKFNGSLFTMDETEPTEPFDADYRRWGGGYWFQNTRLAYWPMLMSGDWEMMRPLFCMYRDALPLAKARTQHYFGHGGAFFPETMTFWGTYLNSNYGYDRTGKRRGEVQNTYIARYWSCALELLTLMLDYSTYTSDETFVREDLVPLAREVLSFYREHYPRVDDDGRTLLKPAQSLEQWHEAVNPLPDIAGLRWVLDGLLSREDLQADDRAAWHRQRQLLPELPSRSLPWDKGRFLLPALIYDLERNSENPELYAVFPYRIFGLGKPDLPVAHATFARRAYQDQTGGWRQDSIQAALLGLADEARIHVVRNARKYNTRCRFPAFWGPNFDWTPDQDHGAVILIALQRMLAQDDGQRILLAPSWPAGWDVRFRLHMPGRTVVTGAIDGGKVTTLQVTPKGRAGNVELAGEG